MTQRLLRYLFVGMSAGLCALLLHSDLSQNAQEEYMGEMRILAGASASIAVRPANASGESLSITTGEELAEALPETARNWLDPNAVYAAMRLPFVVYIDEVEILTPSKPNGRLLLEKNGIKQSADCQPSTSIVLGDDAFQIEGIQRWAGLLSEPQGEPMAAISVLAPDGAWNGPLFLRTQSEMALNGAIRLELHAHPSENEAREAARDTSAFARTARWGAADGASMQWLDSFIPGTGITCADGTAVTLLDAQGIDDVGRRYLLLQVEKDKHVQQVRVTANERLPDAPYQFDLPDSAMPTCILYIGRDGVVLARCGQQGGNKEWSVGEEWRPEGIGITLRLDGALLAAVGVAREDSPYMETALIANGKRLTVREGRIGSIPGFHATLRVVRRAAGGALFRPHTARGSGYAIHAGGFGLTARRELGDAPRRSRSPAHQYGRAGSV